MGVGDTDLVRGFSLFAPGMDEGCDDVYRQLRARCPVGWSDELGGYWVVADYEHAQEVLRDPETFSSAEIAVPAFHDEWGPMLPQQVDAPAHQLYRRDLNALLAPRRVDAFEPRARDLAGARWDALVAAGGGDVKSEFCVPFTSQVAMEFLGFDTADIATLQHWNEQILASLAPDDDAAKTHLRDNVKPQIYRCLAGVLTSRAAQPDPPDDVITGLTRAQVGDRPYTLDEQVRTLYLLINAGLDTTNNVLAMSLWFLATHAGHFDALAASRDVIPAAVEEFARYFNNTAVARVVTADTEVADQAMRAGDLVEVLLPSACRDDAAFSHADSVRFDRPANRHLSFSVGPHRCLGSHLARMEIRVALEELVDRVGEMTLLDPEGVRWQSTYVRKISNVMVAMSGTGS